MLGGGIACCALPVPAPNPPGTQTHMRPLARLCLGSAMRHGPCPSARHCCCPAVCAQELSEAMVERLRSDDAVSALFQQMSDSFPQLLSPLVHERDLYLAWSMKRSKAVNGTRRVVGVVGKGHLRGVVYALLHDNGRLRFADLTGGANRKAERRKRVLVRVAWELALGAGCYAAWLALTATP